MSTKEVKTEQAVEKAQKALIAFVHAASEVSPLELPEVMIAESIPPELMAAMLMHVLPSENRMQRDEKLYWIAVADELGPDWVQELRKVAGFIGKTEEF